METIYVSENTTPFYLARWLFLKKKISQKEFKEYVNMSKEELINILCDFNFKIKFRGQDKVVFEPTGSQLFD